MSKYTKKVRKPIRSSLIQLLAKVDDPKVQIISGEMEVRANPEPTYADDSLFITYKRTGMVDYELRLRIYDPTADDYVREAT